MSISYGVSNFILFTLFFCCSNAFDFFYLVLEWPGSYCDGESSCCYPTSGKPPSDFSIHGLWPNNVDATYPQFCDPSSKFDPSQISTLIPQLNRVWSSLSCPSSNSLKFWEHEWLKHGTCSNEKSAFDYFNKTLQLRNNILLLPALESDGIYPNGREYSLLAVQQALQSALFGLSFGISCNSNHDIYEVYICVDKDAKTLIDCPVLPHSSCSSQVTFPTF